MSILVDRHVHLEGGLDPNWVKANKKDLIIPKSLENLWNKKSCPFNEFIEAYFFCVSFLKSKESIFEAIKAITQRCILSNVKAFDLWCSPHWLVVEKKQITLDNIWKGIEEGVLYAKKHGVKFCVIIDAINHLGIDHGKEVLDLIKQDLPNFVIGFSTGGLERVPFKEWAKIFEEARKLGLKIAAHAGENGSINSVREAVIDGGVDRIVHGVYADTATFELLAEKKIPVDICISSNKLLIPNLKKHPIKEMLEIGVRCALGTDDPGIIVCDIEKEFNLARELGLSEKQIQKLIKNGFEDSWCETVARHIISNPQCDIIL